MKRSQTLTLIIAGLMLAFQAAYGGDPYEGEVSGRPGFSAVIRWAHTQDPSRSIQITSPHLTVRNIGPQDEGFYFQLFKDPAAMKQYMEGKPRPGTEIRERYEKYWGWWKAGNPFTSYLVFLNQPQSEKFLKGKENTPGFAQLREEFARDKSLFVGHVLLEPGLDREGIDTDAEISYVLRPPFWGRGLGTEAVANVVDLARIFLQREMPLNGNLIRTLIATARPDNPGSCRVLEKNDFRKLECREKFGADRALYILGLRP